MTRYLLLTLLLIVALILSIAGIRGTTSRQPPILLFDDMVDQPKYKSQADSAFFPDGRTLRPTPPNTLPFGRPSYSPVQAEIANQKSPIGNGIAPTLVTDDPANFQRKTIPLPIDSFLLSRGQQVYTTYCAVCHGGAGAGNGIVTQYNSATPASYHSDRLRTVTDGYLYQVITEGKGLMGAQGPSLRPSDRWAAVAYVRALQRSQDARLQDVPQPQRQELQRSK